MSRRRTPRRRPTASHSSVALARGVTRPLASEPTRTAGRGERLLVRGEGLGRADDLRRRGRAAEEVGLHLRDAAAAELDVAVALALVAPRELLPVEARRDAVGDDAGSVLREHARLRHWEAHDVAHCVHVRERRHEVVGIERPTALWGEAPLLHHGRRAVDRDPDEQVVRQPLAALEHRLLARRIELDHAVLREVLDPARLELVEEPLRDLWGDGNRRGHRRDYADLRLLSDAPLYELVVQQEIGR